ncbi:hypothetical protein [Amycolatopsis sp. NPDC059021]|uniref:hypothetical protein n=1 Tax=Amycolatopsis sp. NPDC059021 TaxID=3346704 RepID=UPI00366F6731
MENFLPAAAARRRAASPTAHLGGDVSNGAFGTPQGPATASAGVQAGQGRTGT